LAELRDKLLQDKDAYWAEIVDIQRQVATAWRDDRRRAPAEKAGDTVKARQYYAKVVDLARNGDSSREDLAAARKFMAQN
jgi:hypothetical protein